VVAVSVARGYEVLQGTAVLATSESQGPATALDIV